MKKNILFYLVCFCLICGVSCKRHVENNSLSNISSLAQIAGGEVQTDSIVIVDSMRQYNIMAKVNVMAEFPTEGNFFVVNSIREWMSEQLGGSFTGTLDNGKAMMTHYAQERLKDLNVFSEEMTTNDSTIVNTTIYDTDILFEKIYETDQYVTYLYSNQGYSGGAHGWNISYGQTFRKSDGRRIDYDIFQEEELGNLTKVVKNKLMKDYFENDTTDFKESLLVSSEETLPLPEYPPYFTDKGVFFGYQQYEIVGYAAGMPSCVIPYSTIEPMLTLAGKMLLENTAPVASK
ncbi:MAG: RsiV family protein [Bacteroidales bacterium]|nr:RsiV family protein [Bacteroidales bacterium]